MTWTDYSWYLYINAQSVVAALIWLIIILIYSYNKRNKIDNKFERKAYIYSVYYKLGFSLLFGLVYIFIIGGGDTMAYWEASKVMHNIYFISPELYFEQLFSPPNWNNYFLYFNHYVGFPPGFIYREPESYFVSKITTILSFATFKSYLATTLIYASLAANASWSLYQYAKNKFIFDSKMLVIGTLFLPSVAFWCSGISKDAIVYIAAIHFSVSIMKLFDVGEKKSGILIFKLILSGFVMYHTRDFILYVILLVFFASKVLMVLKTKKGDFIFNTLKRTAVFGGFAIILFFLSTQLSGTNLTESSDIVKEAAVVQEDFARNQEYGSNRYSLGAVDFSVFGILKVMPLATYYGIYEPMPWNALSPLLLVNGIEALLFVFLTWQLFRRKVRIKFDYIRNNDFLLFCLFFAIFVGFMAGFSSIIFGVLVRIKALLLPFFMIVLSVDWKEVIERYNRLAKIEKMKNAKRIS